MPERTKRQTDSVLCCALLQDLSFRVLSDEELKAESKRAEQQRQLAAEALLKPKGEVGL